MQESLPQRLELQPADVFPLPLVSPNAPWESAAALGVAASWCVSPSTGLPKCPMRVRRSAWSCSQLMCFPFHWSPQMPQESPPQRLELQPADVFPLPLVSPNAPGESAAALGVAASWCVSPSTGLPKCPRRVRRSAWSCSQLMCFPFHWSPQMPQESQPQRLELQPADVFPLPLVSPNAPGESAAALGVAASWCVSPSTGLPKCPRRVRRSAWSCSQLMCFPFHWSPQMPQESQPQRLELQPADVFPLPLVSPNAPGESAAALGVAASWCVSPSTGLPKCPRRVSRSAWSCSQLMCFPFHWSPQMPQESPPQRLELQPADVFPLPLVSPNAPGESAAALGVAASWCVSPSTGLPKCPRRVRRSAWSCSQLMCFPFHWSPQMPQESPPQRLELQPADVFPLPLVSPNAPGESAAALGVAASWCVSPSTGLPKCPRRVRRSAWSCSQLMCFPFHWSPQMPQESPPQRLELQPADVFPLPLVSPNAPGESAAALGVAASWCVSPSTGLPKCPRRVSRSAWSCSQLMCFPFHWSPQMPQESQPQRLELQPADVFPLPLVSPNAPGESAAALGVAASWCVSPSTGLPKCPRRVSRSAWSCSQLMCFPFHWSPQMPQESPPQRLELQPADVFPLPLVSPNAPGESAAALGVAASWCVSPSTGLPKCPRRVRRSAWSCSQLMCFPFHWSPQMPQESQPQRLELQPADVFPLPLVSPNAPGESAAALGVAASWCVSPSTGLPKCPRRVRRSAWSCSQLMCFPFHWSPQIPQESPPQRLELQPADVFPLPLVSPNAPGESAAALGVAASWCVSPSTGLPKCPRRVRRSAWSCSQLMCFPFHWSPQIPQESPPQRLELQPADVFPLPLVSPNAPGESAAALGVAASWCVSPSTGLPKCPRRVRRSAWSCSQLMCFPFHWSPQMPQENPPQRLELQPADVFPLPLVSPNAPGESAAALGVAASWCVSPSTGLPKCPRRVRRSAWSCSQLMCFPFHWSPQMPQESPPQRLELQPANVFPLPLVSPNAPGESAAALGVAASWCVSPSTGLPKCPRRVRRSAWSCSQLMCFPFHWSPQIPQESPPQRLELQPADVFPLPLVSPNAPGESAAALGVAASWCVSPSTGLPKCPRRVRRSAWSCSQLMCFPFHWSPQMPQESQPQRLELQPADVFPLPLVSPNAPGESAAALGVAASWCVSPSTGLPKCPRRVSRSAWSCSQLMCFPFHWSPQMPLAVWMLRWLPHPKDDASVIIVSAGSGVDKGTLELTLLGV